MNIFDEGVKLDTSSLKRGAKSVDTHIFIRNDLYENLNEIQLNFEVFSGDFYGISELVNMSIHFLVESLYLARCDDERLAILLDLNNRYYANLKREMKQ